MNYGTPGNGTTPQLLHRTPIYADHIPYQGGSQSLTDLICGQIDFMSENLPVELAGSYHYPMLDQPLGLVTALPALLT